MRTLVENIIEQLYGESNKDGWWEGRLSSSALSTALAVFALAQAGRDKRRNQIELGLKWLESNINDDGGWGDTNDSVSNISTTALCWAAFSIAEPDIHVQREIVDRAEKWLKKRTGSLAPSDISTAITASYGADRTFSAPILSMCALAGRLGEGQAAWRLVPQLPFELVVMPRFMFRLLRLSVVSYALPALISIGLVRYENGHGRYSFMGAIRFLCKNRALSVLEKLQPSNGGFLEATPLTSFVVMSLVGAGYGEHAVVKKGVDFIISSMREDGSWPIDTNLATWVTSLAVNALGCGNSREIRSAKKIKEWLLSQQSRQRNIYTDSEPGGWAWTNLPGGVPDADDTSGVLLALKRLGKVDAETIDACANGLEWLINIQNSDGGVPTFCKGWGKLPFDRSCPDITAHALRAMDAWYDQVEQSMRLRMDEFMERGFRYLHTVQGDSGEWIPLWFGNQLAPKCENPTYGTAQVLIALAHIKKDNTAKPDTLITKGVGWLLSAQNQDGGWGGDRGLSSTVEETALAVTALAEHGQGNAVNRAISWLVDQSKKEKLTAPSPVGLYFARLWYSEKLYPLIFTASALLTAEQKGYSL